MSDEDFMEMGDSGLVALEDGWWLHVATGNKIGPNGNIYAPSGQKIGEVVWGDGDQYDE